MLCKLYYPWWQGAWLLALFCTLGCRATEARLGPPSPSRALEGLDATHPIPVVIETDRGRIRCEVDAQRTPQAAALFIGLARGRAVWREPTTAQLVTREFYRDLEVHRAVDGVMIQSGCPRGDGTGTPGYRIAVESRPDDAIQLARAGALVLARYAAPPERADPRPPLPGQVIGSQFAITLVNMQHLAGQVPVIGRCGDLDIVRAIAHDVAEQRSVRLHRINVNVAFHGSAASAPGWWRRWIPSMPTIVDWLGGVMVAYLVLVAPWLGRARYRQLLQRVAAGEHRAREHFYWRALLSKGVTAAVVMVWIAGAPSTLAFQRPGVSLASTVVWLLTVSLVMAASTMVFRRRGDRQLRFLLRTAGGIVPRTSRERLLFPLLCGAAGVTEEIIFRWFLCSYFMEWLDCGLWEGAALASAVFGLAHLYQGKWNVLLTALVGLGFTAIWLDAGTLLVTMVLHTWVNLRISIILDPERIRRLEST